MEVTLPSAASNALRPPLRDAVINPAPTSVSWGPKPVIELRVVADLIPDGSTVFVGGSGGGLQEPTNLLRALGGHVQGGRNPHSLTVWHCSGIGDKKGGGLSLLKAPGKLRRVVGAHWGMSIELARLAENNELEAYNLPQGVISHLLRSTGSGAPGLFTQVGLRTFVDPRVDGGKLNKVTKEEIVDLVTVAGEEYLYFKAPHLDVCLLRATTADEHGNLSFENEAALLEPMEAALATHRAGGIVIVEVQKYVSTGTLNPRDVRVPGLLVDYLVVGEPFMQTSETRLEPGYTGAYRVPVGSMPKLAQGMRRIIAERAYEEIQPGQLVNLGVGMPDGIAKLAAERGELDRIAFAVEQGHIGGTPAGGIEFGAVYNAACSLTAPQQFDLFDGGHLDIAFLGMAEVDGDGNVNVSRYGGGITGAGGFINITQGTHKVVFCGSFTAGGLDVEIGDEGLSVKTEGRHAKFVERVGHLTFSGKRAKELGQEVLYVTERAVFKLTDEGVELVEVVEGVDIERDIIAHMGFTPLIKDVQTIRFKGEKK
ncbi:acyl CoA:acetate/3-ketoacid CoA transferase [Cryobacterium sp. Hh7]|uniref:acyl CoA:acetate/3-ketoacid CoA transferase n=1 Tax=Cryobacterium sp. Hh7 TaxID=1259159 RepID=UPI00106DB702|nr:CoA-transferase [Cryobacterium sp. Hh7]TFD50720.1 acyl CoA:acetate/3-ketoacid CoA transferase [Cryobacterium sp. Hh7]